MITIWKLKGLIASFENTTYIIETPNLEGYILILFLRRKKKNIIIIIILRLNYHFHPKIFHECYFSSLNFKEFFFFFFHKL